MDYVNIFLTLPNPLSVYETNSNNNSTNNNSSPSPSSDSLNSDNSFENNSNLNDDSSESELTNLAWLTEIKNIGNLPLTETTTNNNPTIRFNKFMTEIRRSKEAFEKKSHAYRSNPHEKPPFNYAHIIGMAMMDKEMMTLKDICNWIKENFAYYKYIGNWNNSIRHNLSLSVFFTKVARDKNEKGKGGYWKLAMDYTKTEKKRIRRNKNHSNNNNNNSSNINNNNNNNNSKLNNNNNNKLPKQKSSCVNEKLKSNNENLNNTQIQIEILNDEINLNDLNLTTTSLSSVSSLSSISQHDNLITTISDQNIELINGNGDFVYNMDVCLNDGSEMQTENFYETVAATEVISELNEIFLESDVPQPIDEIALPFVFNLPQNGPNVITEAIPQYTNLPGLDSIDNSDFSSIKFNEYDELDKFLNCNQDFI